MNPSSNLNPLNPIVSVVIPYYDAPHELLHVLAAVRAQDYPGTIEVIVADDGSPTPASEDPLLRDALRGIGASVVRQPDQGFRAAAARNLGARHATGEILAFFDGDTRPKPGFLAAAVPHVVANPRTLVTGSRLTGSNAEEPQWLREAWRHTNHLRDADDTSWRFIISAALVCSRSFLSSLSGFDATLVGYGGEDWELAWRAWNAGAQFVHEPAAIATHTAADFGQRFTDEAEAIRLKNLETIALAVRITHPMCRPSHGVFATADIAVHIPAAALQSGGWQQPGVMEAVISSWLKADVFIYIDGEIPALFTADPRVQPAQSWEPIEAGGVDKKEKKNTAETSHEKHERIRVRLAEPWALKDLDKFYAAVTDRLLRLPNGSEISTARGVSLGLPEEHKRPEEIGLKPVEGPQQLERLFAGW